MGVNGRRKTRSLFLFSLSFVTCVVLAEPLEDWQLEGAKAALGDSNDEVKRLALVKIATQSTPELRPQLFALMNGEDTNLALAAIEALAASGIEANRIASRVVEILGPSPSETSREFGWLRAWKRDPDKHSVSVQELLGDFGMRSRVFAFSAFVAMEEDSSNTSHVVDFLGDIEYDAGAMIALAAMGDRVTAYAPEVRALLEDQSSYTRLRAIHVLMAMNVPVDTYAAPLLDLLNVTEVKGQALELLLELGPQTPALAPILAERLGTFSRDIRWELFAIVGDLGGNSDAELALELLESDETAHQLEAVDFFTTVGGHAQAMAPQIVALMNRSGDARKLEALRALVAINADPATYADAVDSFMDRLPVFRDRVATHVFNALATLDAEDMRQHLPRVVERIAAYSFQDQWLEQAVNRIFRQVSDGAEIATELGHLLDDEKDTTKLLALESLAAIGPDANGEYERVRRFADHTNRAVRRSALNALARIAPGTPGTAALVVEHSFDPATDPWIDELGPLAEMSQVLAVMEPGYATNPYSARHRFVAHFLGGGRADVESMLKWIGGPARPASVTGSVADNEGHLQLLRGFWDAAVPNSRVREELTQQILRVLSATNWRAGHVALLESIAERFRVAIALDETGQMQAALDVVEGKISASRPTQTDWWMSAALWAGGAHLLFWSLLVIAYPRSVWVQTWFFWNPWMLRIAGLGYVNLVLTSVPFLRRLLFAPFRDALVADASLDDLERQAYFAGVQVHDVVCDSVLPIDQAIPEIRGHIYLEGESGFGKSMFLRTLAFNSSRMLAYLPAVRCAGGVVNALQNKLPGVAEDRGFLESLIYAGAFDIVVDGLNEVSAEVRARIIQFLERFTRGNILIASQPIEWNPPTTLHKFTVKPLADDQIEAFLTSRRATQSTHATVTGASYDVACHKFLERTLGGGTDVDVTTRRVLSNPMDLTVVAEMLSLGETPDVFSLQEQQFDHMAAEYTRTHVGATFPLDGLSEVAIAMRMNGEPGLPKDSFDDALNCMERHRMIVARRSIDGTERAVITRYFRHDKVADFFIVHAFTTHPERLLEQLGDARFQGVYLLLAMSLPIDEAQDLCDELLDYAAKTKDHTVSDPFFKLVKERKSCLSDAR
ncbi:MAG: HEAT repeat domain-containing protein [Gammaproteobacteria bacterium]|nr:HEAT repeat domain-containing protein [Gammaproteobacteria bacterium]